MKFDVVNVNMKQKITIPPKPIPVLNTDEGAEDFLDADLSTLDFTQFKPMRFETLPKSAPTPKRRPNP